MMWNRGSQLQAFVRDLPGSRREEPLPRWFGGRVEPVAPFAGMEVTENFEELEEGEDAGDECQELTVSLPLAVVEWLNERSETLNLSVSELVTICAELQMPPPGRDPQ